MEGLLDNTPISELRNDTRKLRRNISSYKNMIRVLCWALLLLSYLYLITRITTFYKFYSSGSIDEAAAEMGDAKAIRELEKY